MIMIRLICLLLLVLVPFPDNDLRACTVFTASDGKSVLVGNNEDSSPSLKSYLWYYPSKGKKHGFVTWGAKAKFPEGGMNEKGLFWDAAALMQAIPTVRDNKKPDFEGYFVDKALSECATVEQVIQLVRRYNLVWQDRAQVLVADASGDYALIHSNYIIRKSDHAKPFFAVTNFSLQDKSTAQSACYRYNAAQHMLAQQPVSMDLFCKILAKAAQKAPNNATIYSQIADLKSGTFQLYQKHNFDQLVTIDLAKELKKGAHQVEMKRLFPTSIREHLGPIIARKGITKAISEYEHLRKTAPQLYDFSESELDELAYSLLNQKKINEGIEILRLNQSNFPASDRGLSSLASACLLKGDHVWADSLFSQALLINPDNYVANLFLNQPENLVTFRMNALEYAGKIQLVGSFNNWDTTVNAFVKNPEGEWICQLKLKPGIYQYTLLVGDDNWMTDPLNQLAKQDGKYWRSVLIVR